MSITNIEQSNIVGSKGIERVINEGAMKLVLDTIQISQYSKPEESTVRELTSNAVDSQKEKEKAIEILTGAATADKYYITRTGNKYNDSNWNPSYYNLDCLDKTKNYVELRYKEGSEGVGYCDSFHVIDYGVGLGDKRLQGIFEIGFSSKRNSVNQLGGFGFGAKVALSLRNDYYSMITVHNKRKFKFNCYSYKIDKLIGKLNTVTGKENNYILFYEGTDKEEKIYYEDTDELNSTEIIVPCKKHHRTKFISAVRNQLLYFDNVKFYVVNEEGREREENFRAKVLYNSKNIIISDNYQFSKPHVIVVKDEDSEVGVSYGYVAFNELELEDLNGNIGLKCPIKSVVVDEETGAETILQDGISVTPSRESIIWDDNTREFIKKRFQNVVEEATVLIQKELVEKDILLWLEKANSVLGSSFGYGGNNILNRMKAVIDVSAISPKFTLDESIEFGNPGSFFWGTTTRLNTKRYDYKKGKDIIEREEVSHWSSFTPSRVYLQTGETSPAKDFYLAHTLGANFVTIKVENDEKLKELYTNSEKTPKIWTDKKLQTYFDKRDKIISFIKKSKNCKVYEDVVVPADWQAKFDKAETEDTTAAQIKALSPAELRKLAEKTIMFHPAWDDYRSDNKQFSWVKAEPVAKDFIVDEAEVVYGFGKDEEKILFLSYILQEGLSTEQSVDKAYQVSNYTEDFKLVRIAENNKKYAKSHIYIDKYFKNLTDKNELVMSDKLVKWNTARIIHNNLEKIKFFNNYGRFNKELAEYYKELLDYSLAYYKDWTENYAKNKLGCKQELFDDLIAQSDNIMAMQLFVREHAKDKEAITNKSIELFGSDAITDGLAIETSIYDKLQMLLDYSSIIGDLFNHLVCLTTTNFNISAETENLINEIIVSKELWQKEKSPESLPLDVGVV